MKYFLVLALFLTLTACIIPIGENFPKPQPVTPTSGASYTQCAYVEGRRQQPELSAILVEKLKAATLPVETARAEAYGENCIAANNTVVSFSQRETDFYITLHTPNLTDQTALGNLLEKALTVIDQLPPEELGPNPGYIGVTFQAGSQEQNLWFTQAAANNLRKQGLKGADLYQALSNNNP